MFSKIYFKSLSLTALIIAVYTAVMIFLVSPTIEKRASQLEERTGKAHLQEISAVVASTAKQLKSYEENSLALHKKELKNITDVAFTLVEKLYASTKPEAIRTHILDEVALFQGSLSNFYAASQKNSISTDCRNAMREFVMLYRYDGRAGHFFIDTESIPDDESLKTGSSDPKKLQQQFAGIVQSEKQGFVSYNWFNPDSQKIEKKLTYVFYYAPMNWIIGTGLFPAEVTRQKQQEAIEYVKDLRYDDNEYFYISNYDSVLISHPSLQGRDMSQVTDPEGILIVPPMVKIAREKGEGFHSYSWIKLQGTDQLFKKLTFAKHIPDWKWVIGTGIYLDSIEQEVEKKKAELITDLRTLLTNTRIGDTGYIYLFDSKGNMMLHPNSNIEDKNFSTLRNPGKKSFILTDLVNAYKSGKKVLYYTWDKPDDKGNYIYEKVSWIDYNKDFDWYICSSAYLAEITATATRMQQYIWFTSSILLLLALCTSAYFFKKLLAPIETLSGNARRVKNGDLSVRSNIRSTDEIGTLAQTFDGMLDTIEDNIQTLDKKVSERTEDLQRMVAKLDYLASHDPLTGIFNRRKFFELASALFLDRPSDLYAAMIDIDTFKAINDAYGHPVGDLMIIAVTETISNQMEKGAVFGRLGGEEFAIIGRNPDRDGIRENLEQIREEIARLQIKIEGDRIIGCTISLGVVQLSDDDNTLDELLHRADDLLYSAKNSGRNKTIFRI